MWTYRIEDSKHYEGPRGIMQFMDYSPRDCFFVVMDANGNDVAVSKHQKWTKNYCDKRNVK